MKSRNYGSKFSAIAKQSTQTEAKNTVARINELTRTARTTWFGMLSFLTFVAVTLMGVRDADFFLTERETALPLVGVSVPTSLFFAFTPILGSILYAYFHLHLLKLWEELANAPSMIDGKPLSDQIAPWLISDLALGYKSDAALTKRPLRWASHWVNLAIAFAGTPIVLTGFWWRSFAPHQEWLTLIACGGPLIFSIYVGTVSWWRLQSLLNNRKSTGGKKSFALLVSVTLLVTGIGWLRVEGNFAGYTRFLGLDYPDDHWLVRTFHPDLLYSADLANVNFSNTPEDWVSRELFREAHRPTWCKTVGIPPDACGPPPSNDAGIAIEVQPRTPTETDNQTVVSREPLILARNRHCKTMIVVRYSQEACKALFARLDQQFEAHWLRQRELAEANLRSYDFRGADLREANLRAAELQGADLLGAELQGADLEGAKLQEANLINSQLQGASLVGAQLQGASLVGAQLQGAELLGAELQGADLIGAKLQGADLFGANLREANLLNAQLQGAFLFGANLREANLQGAELQGANLEGAKLQGANLKWAELQGANLTWEELQGANFEWAKFDRAWRAFLRSIGQDPDNPK